MWNTAFANLTRAYQKEVWSLRDPRLDGLPLMGEEEDGADWVRSRFGSVLAVCLAYVAFSVAVGPALMRGRRPVDVQKIVLGYNIVQVVLNTFLVVRVVFALSLTGFDLSCQEVDYSMGGDAETIARMSYCFFLIKFLDMLDTVFFVLRKRQHQITFLHVYHHFVIPLYLWPSVRFAPGGNNVLPSLLNGAVHAAMYAYYFAAALPRPPPALRRATAAAKRWVTTAQLAQFALVLAHTAAQPWVSHDCGFPPEQTVAQIFLVVPFLVLFLNFYVREYVSGENRRAEKIRAPITELNGEAESYLKKE